MLLISIIVLGSALYTHVLPPSNDSTRHVKKLGLRFLALGDSYTIGEGVAAGERWPAILTGLLRSNGVPMSDPVIIAKTGWTTDELSVAVKNENPEGTFDIVSLLIGVNNQYRGREVENYRNEFRDLLLRAIAFAGDKRERVVVLSIPDWGVTPFAEGRDRTRIAQDIDLFNEVNREESSRNNVHYVDITPFSRAVANDTAFLAGDGLHPSGKMYEQWAQDVLRVVLPQLDQTLE